MTESVLATLRIVLVEPAGALNVGAIARVMKNMGLHHLVLVNPHCDQIGEEARLMAVHAADVLEGATVVKTLPEALQGCQRAIATTARPRVATVLEPPRTALPWLLEAAPQERGALIFGPEDRGLSNEELNYAQRFVAIPSHPTYPALNLAQAVAICCYELYQWEREQESEVRSQESEAREEQALASSEAHSQHLNHPSKAASPLPPPLSPPATLDILEGYYQQLEEVLLAIGYLQAHTAASRMQKFRRLFNRAFPSNEEVAMLRGILSQVAWATQKANQKKTEAKSTQDLVDDR
ncbi:RNA methyltransferase [Stenomitos frigidus]|uniref:tRNA (cytidine/uridine-2'-O-)-methyltransferase TrmJ n=1 Tax=Stenomitos frigidus ULC18 TaxID=2107698 RepID=A0A2T1DYF2_9CYAN|nr:RNA methyltransferase [Stenomitos frigidus]PSB25489.1 RNA methyltransferase [Stenomitos frigidus ULC18]